MMPPKSLYESGIRPLIDDYLESKKQARNLDHWRASWAGYCWRYNIMRRLDVPPVPEKADSAAIQTRVFEAGHIFHEWLQRITKGAGLSIASEVEIIDKDLNVTGHFDDLIQFNDSKMILMDYKTAHSRAFDYAHDEIGYYHRMQLGTYLYIMRYTYPELEEARILQLEKDTLRMREWQLKWSPELESEIEDYWKGLNEAWKLYNKTGELPACICLDEKKDGGWFGRRTKFGKIYNDYFYQDEPCSEVWFRESVKERVSG